MCICLALDKYSGIVSRLNSPSKISTQSSMAMRAPVLSPAEERNASPWHTFSLVPLWQEHTLSVRVLVLLRMGSPSSHTTTGSSYSSWVSLWKRRRLAMMLAVLSADGRTGKVTVSSKALAQLQMTFMALNCFLKLDICW